MKTIIGRSIINRRRTSGIETVQLVALKGGKWTEIVRVMGKYDNDLKALFTRLISRITDGRFSLD